MHVFTLMYFVADMDIFKNVTTRLMTCSMFTILFSRYPGLRPARVDKVQAVHSGRSDGVVPRHPPPRHALRGHSLRDRLSDRAGAA